MNFNLLYEKVGDMAARKFPDCPPATHLLKLRHEAQEAIDDPGDIREYADCLISLLAAAHKEGIPLHMLLEAADLKLQIIDLLQFEKREDGAYQPIK